MRTTRNLVWSAAYRTESYGKEIPERFLTLKDVQFGTDLEFSGRAMQLLTQLKRLAGFEREEGNCLFCEVLADRSRTVFAENANFLAVFDQFPVNEGHALLIPKRHVHTIFELREGEALDFLAILQLAKKELDQRYHPDAYNVGINSGEAAGQTISHLHVHLIPRYQGDVEDPRGGIRNFKSPLVPY